MQSLPCACADMHAVAIGQRLPRLHDTLHRDQPNGSSERRPRCNQPIGKHAQLLALHTCDPGVVRWPCLLRRVDRSMRITIPASSHAEGSSGDVCTQRRHDFCNEIELKNARRVTQNHMHTKNDQHTSRCPQSQHPVHHAAAQRPASISHSRLHVHRQVFVRQPHQHLPARQPGRQGNAER